MEEKLPFILPGKTSSETLEQHWKRYFFARKFVKNKTVLDVACGSGYGSFILSKYAKTIVGVDMSQDALKYAKKNYSAKNLRFYQMDAKKLGYPDNFFDIVISFETIEHVRKYDLFLKEIKRVLKVGGTVIMSTPNFGFPLPKNKFHISNFTKDEFISLFSKNFSNVEFFGQSKKFISFPGRGILERIIGIRRNENIYKLDKNQNPRNIIASGIKK